MPKDAYYFSHDSNSKDDPKCAMLIEQLGLEGYGIFWVLVETLRDQPGYKYPLAMLPILARKYNTTHKKVKIVIGAYGLFEIDGDQFFSLSLCRRMGVLETVRELNRQKGIKSGQARRLLSAAKTAEPQLNSGSTVVEQVKESKVKESKKKKSKEEQDRYDYFSDFWSEYPKKESKLETMKVFATLHMNDELMEKVMAGLDRAITKWRKDEMKFVPQAPRWLRGRRWEDGL